MELSDLPDDVVSQIIKHVPSLCDKFKLAALSQQFRRRVFEELKTPRPLVIDFPGGQLNGHPIPIDNWPTAVQVLAKESQFSKLSVNIEKYEDSRGWYKKSRLSVGVLKAICESPECLGRLTTIEHDKLTSYEGQWIAQIIRCSQKISHLKLRLSSYGCCSNILSPITPSLRDKNLIEVDISSECCGGLCTVGQLIEFFEAAKSDTLRNIRIVEGGDKWEPIRVLETFVTSRVETMELFYGFYLPSPPLFEVIARLSTLKKCTLKAYLTRFQPVADCVATYFSNLPADPEVERILELFWAKMHLCGCLLIELVESIKQKVPGVHFEIETSVTRGSRPHSVLKFSSNKSTITISDIKVKREHKTAACDSFYVNLLACLQEKATRSTRNTRLHHCFLDRCKMNRVVADLNELLPLNIRALSAVPNEAQTEVTVTFEMVGRGYITVTVKIQHCFDADCSGCFEI